MLLVLMLPFCVLLSPRYTLFLITLFQQRIFTFNISDGRLPPPKIFVLSLLSGCIRFKPSPKETATGMLIRFWWKRYIFRFVWSYRRRKSETALTERQVLCLERGPGIPSLWRRGEFMDIGYRCYGGHQFFHHQLQFRPQTGICLMPGIHSFPCCSVNPGAVTQSRSGKAQVGKRTILSH